MRHWKAFQTASLRETMLPLAAIDNRSCEPENAAWICFGPDAVPLSLDPR